MKTWRSIQKDITKWASKTFPHQTPLSKIAHIRKEIDELEYEIKNERTIDTYALFEEGLRPISIPIGGRDNELMEFADIEILLKNLQQMRGITPRKLKKAVRAKMKINKQRE